jgi:GNAT superfamily N-acetyltransferase
LDDTVKILSAAEAEGAVTVLCDAFYDYPVMRYVLGPATASYDHRLRTLIGFFVSARVLREELVLGIHDEAGILAGVALVTLPGERAAPEALLLRREAVWRELGTKERDRYEAFGEAGREFTVEAPHHHLNMIAVRRSHSGLGFARQLLDGVHDLAQHDSNSSGVTLSTEDPKNLPLYQKFGYQLLGHARVADELETWAFFRPATVSRQDIARKSERCGSL